MNMSIVQSSLRLFTLVLAALLDLGCAGHPKGDTAPAGTLAGLQFVRTIALPGVGVPATTLAPNAIPGRLDHLAYDPATERLYVAALEQGSLEVIDLKTGVRVKRIEGLKRPQGLAVVRSKLTATAHQGWIVLACGGDGTVRAYDAVTVEETAVTPAGENADNVRFDGATRVYVGTGGNEGPGGLAVFDAATLARIGTVPLPLRPESFQLNLNPGDTRLFANSPGSKTDDNDGSVVVADRATGVLLAMWRIPGGARNFPLAYDAKHERLFFACRKPAKVFMLDAKSGTILSRAPCVADSDDLFFDEATSTVMVIGGGRRSADPATAAAPTPGADAAVDVFVVSPDGQLTQVGSTFTSPHARTGLFVPQRRMLYVVAPPHGGEDAKLIEFLVPR